MLGPDMTRSFAIPSLALMMSGLAFACSGPVTPSNGGMGPVAMQACPTSGPGAVTGAGSCWVFSPASAGASALGQNASRLNYPLEPSGSARRTLVVMLNGSGSSLAQLTIDTTRNLFTAALENGSHGLAIA
jgi:hypothetical protein